MPSCRQCRARKVRCDRRPGQCSGCSRLAVACVYPEARASPALAASASAASASSAVSASSPTAFYSRFRLNQTDLGHDRLNRDTYTEAGLKRRRTLKACLACRRDKIKCSGSHPCTRCKTRNTNCDWEGGRGHAASQSPGSQQPPGLSVSQPRTEAQTGLSPVSIGAAVENTPGDEPFSESSYSEAPTREAGDVYHQLDNTTVRRYIDAYFLYGHTSGFLFPILLKSLVLADWKNGKINPLLLKAMIAFGVCLSHDERRGSTRDDQSVSVQADEPHAVSADHGKAWISDVRRDILLGHLGDRPSIALIQTLVILMRYYLLAGHDRITTWNLLALAARFMFSLALNYEDTSSSIDATTRETRRRAVWAVYAIDQLLCGGIDDLSVCQQSRIHIRFPCSEQSFQRGIQSAAPFPNDMGTAPRHPSTDHEDMDMLAFYLQLLGHRHKILQYTKRLRISNTSPETSKDELGSLQQGLTAFAQTLPAHLRNTTQNMVLMAHATDADADWYLNLHTLFLQCHCDLYRHTVPRLREALPPDVMRMCSPGYITACQDACLDAAVALCRLWTDARQLDFSRNGSRALFLAACMYQVAQILIHLRHRLERGDRQDTTRGVLSAASRLAESLNDAFMLLGDPQHHAALTERPYVQELRNMISILGSRDSEASHGDKDVDKPRNGQMYLSISSRHSLIETLSGEPPEAAGDVPSGRDNVVGDNEASTSSSSSAHIPHSFGQEHRDDAVVVHTDNLGYGADDGLLQEVIPWGMDYYDPMLGLVADGLGDSLMPQYEYGVAGYQN